MASGIAFGAASYSFYGRLPDIHGIAVAALLVKIGCAISGAAVAFVYLEGERCWTARRRDLMWVALIGFAVIALTAAAFLRWFS